MRWGRALAAAISVAAPAGIVPAPAAAQHYSDGFNFLKAVKDRDATKATALIGRSGTTVINVRNPDTGEGALHIVARDRDIIWLGFLLGKGARPDLQNSLGETPLSLAAQVGWTDGAGLLLSRGAAVDLGNVRGETPLILAVHRRDLAMVRLLLSHGANPVKADRFGFSALDYARQDPRAGPLVRLLEAGPGASPAHH